MVWEKLGKGKNKFERNINREKARKLRNFCSKRNRKIILKNMFSVREWFWDNCGKRWSYPMAAEKNMYDVLIPL